MEGKCKHTFWLIVIFINKGENEMSIKETNVVVDTHSNQRAVLGNTEIRQCIFEGFIALLVEILVEMCVHDGFEVHLLDDRLLLNIELTMSDLIEPRNISY